MQTRTTHLPSTRRYVAWLAFLVMLGALTLGGCGKKGPLYLPTPPQDGARS